MKIKSISIEGFRGFNEERTIDFHDRLTLIYGPNSYGKTSVSEALEWLIYGVTSKVEKADSKEEYRGSYRNRHVSESLTPFVRLILIDEGSEIELRGELAEDDFLRRFVNRSEVKEWPFSQSLSTAPRPFILQHALKYLLLVRPDERFQGFARLLGLEDLDQVQRNVIALCTKPDKAIPEEGQQLMTKVNALVARLESQVSLGLIAKSLRKGSKSLAETYRIVAGECKRRVPPETEEESVLPQLLKIREDAVEKIFKGQISLPGYTEKEKQSNSDDEDFFINFLTDAFIQEYTQLIALATVQQILERAQFFDLGVKFLDATPGKCPFCGQPVDNALSQHIRGEHEHLTREKQGNAALERQRAEVLKSLKELRSRLSAYQTRHLGKATPLLALEISLAQLKMILVPKHQPHFNAVESAISQVSSAKTRMENSYGTAVGALNRVETSIEDSRESDGLTKALGDAVVEYIANARSFIQVVSNNVSAVSDANQILRHELDTLAGTSDIGVLIDLLERRRDIEK